MVENVIMTDQPTSDDLLDTKQYAEVLADYIHDCATPLTVAIQGDWGSGKTSTMQMVENRLREEHGNAELIVKFNTWQYSQMNMSDSLVLALMSHLIESVATDIGKAGQDNGELAHSKRKLLRRLGKSFASSAAVAAREVAKWVPTMGVIVQSAESGIEAFKEYREQADELNLNYLEQLRGSAKVVETLREEIEQYVEQALDEKGAARMVVFIDDLDRLEPQRAVEVLEAIKVFLDVKRCVYVLAIDFNVVKQGVREKFGGDFDEQKAQAFFDKIIQVPFHMPVNRYNIKKLLDQILGLPSLAESEKRQYVHLAQRSVGNNPRALKRLSHTFRLLKRISAAEVSEKGNDDLQLFAVLCLQTAFPVFYREFEVRVREFNESDAGFANYLRSFGPKVGDQSDDKPSERWQAWGIRELDVIGFQQFMATVAELFEDSKEGDVSGLTSLQSAMQLGAITSVGNAQSKPAIDSMYVGIEEVSKMLRHKGVDNNSIDEFKKLVDKLSERFESHQFEVAVGDTDSVKLYANPCADKMEHRGLIAEALFSKSGFTLQFGRKTDDKTKKGVVAGWYLRLQEVFDDPDATDWGPERDKRQIHVKVQSALTGAQMETLYEVLVEAREIRAKKRNVP